MIHYLHSNDALPKEESKRKNRVHNGLNGAYGSGGSMGNPMYQSIHSDGHYIPTKMRNYRRARERAALKQLRTENTQASKFHNGFA